MWKDGNSSDVTKWALNYINKNAPKLLSVVACSEVFDSSKGGAGRCLHAISWKGANGPTAL